MKNKKKLLVIIVVFILLLVGLAVVLGKALSKQEAFLVTLNERDVTLDVGETLELQMLPIDEEDKLPKYTMEWKSSNPKVATVDENGLVTAIAGGETKITVIIKTKDQEYSASCVITVPEDGEEYATYTIRWFTQEKDRDGYEVTEESFERLIGSDVVIETSYALSKTPSKNYVFNEKKSNLKGTVKKNKGLILEVYYDVAEVTYSVNAYYETADLGVYIKETQQLKAYAFTEVTAPDLTKTGYVFNKDKAGTVTKIKEVQAGSQLASYYNRVRANVTISYISGKPSVTYQCVYGVGIQNVPAGVFEDSMEPYAIAPYAHGKKITSMEDFLKTVTKDTTIEYKVNSENFTYSAANGGTLTNNTTKAKVASYAYLNGKSSTIYLEGTYNLTGNTDNLFGVELKSGGTTREIRFSEYGFTVMKDHKKESGIIGKKLDAYNYASATVADYAWAQNLQGNTKSERNSVIKKMVSNMDASQHKIVWAVWEGTLYAQVDGEVCLRLPLSLLDESWTADAEYEIAFSTWDNYGHGDELSISGIRAGFGEDAENKLVLGKQVSTGLTRKVHFEPITGSYIPESYTGASYIYSEEATGDVAVRATVSALDLANTVSNVGVSVMVNGDASQSVQVFTENNSTTRYTTAHSYGTRVTIPAYALLDFVKPYQNGVCELTGVVKNGTLYILFNGKQAYAFPIEAILSDYNPTKDKISIGIATNDATLGLYTYKNLSFLSGKQVADIEVGTMNISLINYSGSQSAKPTISMEESRIMQQTNNISGAYSLVKFVGSSKTWELTGTVSSDAAVNWRHQLYIECGNVKTIMVPRYGNPTAQSGGFGLNGTATENQFKYFWSLEYKNKDVSGIFNDGTATNDNNVAGIQTSVFELFKDKAKDKVNFKYQIVDDVLYAWYCAANVDINTYATASNYAWKIDLTSKNVGGFTAGSKYTVGLRTQNTTGSQAAPCEAGNSITENLNVKVGSQVDKTIAQTIQSKYWKFNLNYEVVSNQAVNEQLRANRVKATEGISAIYYPESSDVVWTSAKVTYRHSKNDGTKQKPIFGINVATEDGRNIQLHINSFENNKGGVLITGDNTTQVQHSLRNTYGAVGHYTNGIEVFADCTIYDNNKGSYAYSLREPADGKQWNIKAAIYNNVLYVALDDVLLYAFPLTALNANWTAGTSYYLGYSCYEGYNRGFMQLSEMQAFYGTEAKDKLKLPSDVQKMDERSLMTYNPLNGTYVPSTAAGDAYAYSGQYAQGDIVAMRTTIIEREETKGTIAAGIAVKMGNAYRYILNNEDGYGDIAITKVNPLTLTVVVKDEKLYIWGDNDATPIYEEKLKDVFGDDYDKSAKVQIGIVAKDSDKAAEIFTDTKLYTGEPAENVYTAMINGTEIQKTPMDIYLIAGQSNAAGSTHVASSKVNVMDQMQAINPKYISGYDHILYSGTINTLSVSLATTKANVHKNGSMGPEMGMAESLSTYYNENTGRFAGLIKYGYGGTSLLDKDDERQPERGNWVSPSYKAKLIEENGSILHGEKTGELYNNLLAQVERSLQYYVDAGYTPVIKGLYWMQGEDDRTLLEEYKRAFGYFATDIRKDLAKLTEDANLLNMPIIIGEISKTFGGADDNAVALNTKFIELQHELAETIDHCYIAYNGKYAITEIVDGKSQPVEYCVDTAHWNWKDCLAIGRDVGDIIKKDILSVTR